MIMYRFKSLIHPQKTQSIEFVFPIPLILNESINDSTILFATKNKINDTIELVARHLHPELPILTNMMCDELYNIDSEKSKLEALKSRSCLFTNHSLCYSFIKKKWIYYTNIDALVYDINGQLRKLRLPLLINNVIDLRIPSSTRKSREAYAPIHIFNFTITKNNINHTNNTNKRFLIDYWTIYGTPTVSGTNIGHVLWDTYYKVYKAMDNFVYNGIMADNTLINVIFKLNKGIWHDDILPKYRAVYEPILFNDVTFGMNELYDKYSRFNEICFKNIVIGTNEYSGMLNAIHTNNQLLKFIRKKILNYFNLNDLHIPNKINILFLKKSMSYWKNNNFIININNDEIINATINKYLKNKEINIMTLDPHKIPIEKQINILYNSLIIISPIGGIGWTNIFQPLNGVQIYLLKWAIHEDYLPENFNQTFIPWHDSEMHNTQTLQTILKYCDLSDKYNYTKRDYKWRIKQNLLFPIIDHAIQIIKERFTV